MSGWIGVDLDGTLAVYGHWKHALDIGEPVPAMLERVKAWVAKGQEVRIFTARVSMPRVSTVQSRTELDIEIITDAIQDWCEQHGLPRLDVTNQKDFQMIELWDDRCVAVELNTGRILGGGR